MIARTLLLASLLASGTSAHLRAQAGLADPAKEMDRVAFADLVKSAAGDLAEYRRSVAVPWPGTVRVWHARPIFGGLTNAFVVERRDGTRVAYRAHLHTTSDPVVRDTVFRRWATQVWYSLGDWERVRVGPDSIRWNECAGGTQGRSVLLFNEVTGPASSVGLEVGSFASRCDSAALAATAREAREIIMIEELPYRGELQWSFLSAQMGALIPVYRSGSVEPIWVRKVFRGEQRQGPHVFDTEFSQWSVDCGARTMASTRSALARGTEIVAILPRADQPFRPGPGSIGEGLIQRVCDETSIRPPG